MFSRFFQPEFMKFVSIGGVNTLGGTIYSYVFSLLLQENVAFVLGYITSLTIAYFLNSIFVFKQRLGLLKYAKFCVSYIPNFIIQNVIVLAAYNALHWHKLIAFALAAAIGIPVTYIILRACLISPD
jgi:putative flippase GtrA